MSREKVSDFLTYFEFLCCCACGKIKMPPGTVLNTAVERRFRLLLRFRVPEGNFPCFAGLVHVDDALVRRAAKAQGNVFEFIDECAVDEHVERDRNRP